MITFCVRFGNYFAFQRFLRFGISMDPLHLPKTNDHTHEQAIGVRRKEKNITFDVLKTLRAPFKRNIFGTGFFLS